MYIYIYICRPSFFSKRIPLGERKARACTRHASNRRPPPTFCFSSLVSKKASRAARNPFSSVSTFRGYVQPLTVACQLLTTYETEPVPEQTYANVCRVVCNLLARPSLSLSLSPPFSFPLFPSRLAHTCDAFPCQGDRGAGSADFPFFFLSPGRRKN